MQDQASRSVETRSARQAVLVILAISALATLFLFWLIYIHPASDKSNQHFAFLSPLNAFLNGLSAIAIVIGVVMIRAKRLAEHRAAMSAAFAFSVLFLAGYILHHALHGDVRYPLHAAFRTLYLSLLASHILFATATLPLALATFFFSLSGRIPQHKRIARWTFPLWLYVSITGVVTYAMLRTALM